MVRKNYKLNILLRLVIICSLIGLALYYLLIEVNYIRTAYLIVFFALALWELFFYIDRVNRDLATFFTALSQNDFTTSFNAQLRGKSFKQLYTAINTITNKFKDLRAEKEQQLLFLEMLVEHVKAGIISYDSTEKVVLMNQSLQRMLNKPKLHYLKALTSTDEMLLNTIREIKAGENKLLKLKVNERLLRLSIHASEFHIGDDYYKLLSVQDIKNELEVNEVETWQKLIRVLTHEIMNSVAPITSLSDTLLSMVKNNVGELPKDETKNLISGLEAIKVRSNGLEKFTQAYRQLTRIPKPVFQNVSLNELIEKVVLLQKGFIQDNIEITVHSEVEINTIIDPDLIAQALINIIKNAQEALQGEKEAHISIHVVQNKHIEVRVTDNGPGIPEDIAEQIFVPFFTTKHQGSGIGLALSRQIMHLHRGTLVVESTPGKYTMFIMRF